MECNGVESKLMGKLMEELTGHLEKKNSSLIGGTV